MCQYHPRDQWHHIYLYALSFSAQTLNLWRSKLALKSWTNLSKQLSNLNISCIKAFREFM